MSTKEGWKLYEEAKRILPGGTQLLSKRPEQFAPGIWPPYYSRAEGCSVWDLDGNRYDDLASMGIGTSLLGYACPQVNVAVKQAVDAGSMSTLNCPEEVELAELLLGIHPWASKVRYARTGGEIMAVAVRIARARTGRDHVAFCGYHGWHDWYLAANLSDGSSLDEHLLPGLAPKGVPRALAGTMHPFHYNSIDELRTIFAEHGPQLAAVVMEPIREKEPAPGFLSEVRRLSSDNGSMLVFDEITSGWRHTLGGAHLLFDARPDLAVFAKALGNGFPIAAVIGTSDAMEAAQSTFISSTYWTERIGPTAAIATVRRFRELGVPELLRKAGEQVREAWQRSARESGVDIEISGRPALLHFSFRHPERKALSTLFTQEMLERGFLANPSFYASVAHTEQVIERYEDATRESFREVARAIDGGNIEACLKGGVAHSGFARLT